MAAGSNSKRSMWSPPGLHCPISYILSGSAARYTNGPQVVVAAVPGFDVPGTLRPPDGHLPETLRLDCADHRVGTWEVAGRIPDVGDSGAWEDVCFAHTSILSLCGLRYTGLSDPLVVEVPVVTWDTGPDLMFGVAPTDIAVGVVVTLVVASAAAVGLSVSVVVAHSHSRLGGLPRH